MVARFNLRFVFLAAALLLAGFPQGALHASTAAPIVLQLGFGPQELFNVANGIPIFVLGDQMWASYFYNESLTLELVSPSGTGVSAAQSSPNSVFLFHTLNANDAAGLWTLNLRSPSGVPVAAIQVEVRSPQSSPPGPPRLESSTISKNGSLVLSFTESINSASDLSACLLPGAAVAPAFFRLPSQVGNYTLELDQKNNSLNAQFFPMGGGTLSPFDMWVELRYSYSFTSSLNPYIVIRGEARAAYTQPATFSSPLTGRNFTLALNEQGQLRVGSYSVLVYFRSLAGLFVYQTTVLMLDDGTWIWDGACSPLVSSSGNFRAVIPLNSPGSWPSTIIVTYQDNGTQGYVEAKVPTNLTSVYVAPIPWGGQLPQGYTVGVTSNADVASFQIFNSSIYVQLRHTPTKFQTYVQFQGSNFATKTFNVTGKYQLLQWGIPLGKLQVAVQLDARFAPGASISVTDQTGVAATGKTDSAGTWSFLLPPGRYSVKATLGNGTSIQPTTISGTLESTLVFSFTTPVNYTPQYVLLGLAILGTLANLWIWRGVLRRGSS